MYKIGHHIGKHFHFWVLDKFRVALPQGPEKERKLKWKRKKEKKKIISNQHHHHIHKLITFHLHTIRPFCLFLSNFGQIPCFLTVDHSLFFFGFCFENELIANYCYLLLPTQDNDTWDAADAIIWPPRCFILSFLNK